MQKLKTIITTVSAGALALYAFAVFAHTEEGASPQPTSIRPELRTLKQDVRNEIKNVRKEVRTDIKETRQNLQGDIRTVKEGVQNEVRALRETTQGNPEKIKEAQEVIKQKREAAKELMEAKQEEFKQLVETKHEELKKKVEAKRKELKKKLEAIRDERKKQAVQKLDAHFDEINANRTEHFTENINQIEKVLQNVVSRTDKAADKGRDVAAARTAITAAQAAIATSRAAITAQAGKTYPIAITTESNLRSNVGTVRTALERDLAAVRETVRAAHDAVRKAAVALAQIPRVDEVKHETPTPTATPTSTSTPIPTPEPAQ